MDILEPDYHDYRRKFPIGEWELLGIVYSTSRRPQNRPPETELLINIAGDIWHAIGKRKVGPRFTLRCPHCAAIIKLDGLK